MDKIKKSKEVKEEKEKKLGPWDFITLMKRGEYNCEEHDKLYSSYMLSRILSTDVRLAPMLNMINRYGSIPNEIHFQYCQSILSFIGGNPYTAYNKEGISVRLQKDREKEKLMVLFECGEEDYNAMIELLTEEQIDDAIKYVDKNHIMENNSLVG